MAKHLGTELNACPCYWPRKKGKVERPFNYIEEQFIKGNTFSGMDELNRRGKAFIDEWCEEKHTTTRRIPTSTICWKKNNCCSHCQSFIIQPAKCKNVLSARTVSLVSTAISTVSLLNMKNRFIQNNIWVQNRAFWHQRKPYYALEASDRKYDVVADPDHYKPIAKKVSPKAWYSTDGSGLSWKWPTSGFWRRRRVRGAGGSPAGGLGILVWICLVLGAPGAEAFLFRPSRRAGGGLKI